MTTPQSTANVFFGENFRQNLFRSFQGNDSNAAPSFLTASQATQLDSDVSMMDTSMQDDSRDGTSMDSEQSRSSFLQPHKNALLQSNENAQGGFFQQILQTSQTQGKFLQMLQASHHDNAIHHEKVKSDSSHAKQEHRMEHGMLQGSDLIFDNASRPAIIEEKLKKAAFKSISKQMRPKLNLNFNTASPFRTNSDEENSTDDSRGLGEKNKGFSGVGGTVGFGRIATGQITNGGVLKNKRKFSKFKPRNIKLNIALDNDYESNNRCFDSATNLDDPHSRKYEFESLRIGSQGIEKLPFSFATQSQSQMHTLTPLSTESNFTSSSIFEQTSEEFNSPPKNTKARTSDVDFKNLELLSHLGSGASSTVDLVVDKGSGQQYAVKRVFKDSNFDPTMIKSELRALYKCRRCPNIVRFFNASYHDSKFSIVLEYMNGNSLEDILKKKSSIPENVLGYIVVSVLRGLSYLHAKRIVHRDIKPANILVSKCGVVKISDFGLTGSSKQGYGPKNKHVFESCKGTIIYMSPERIEEAGHSYNCDVWSLGVTVAELRNGKFPFLVKGSYFDILDHVKSFGKTNLDPAYFSEGLQSFIEECCIIDPQKRPSAEELLGHPWLAPFTNVNESKKVISKFLES